MKVTREYRKEENILFITVKKPHKAASTQTISRWIKNCLISYNIGVEFTAHSTRHAATSAALRKGVDINVIRNTAGWSENSKVFARFYNRPIAEPRGSFAEAILNKDKVK